MPRLITIVVYEVDESGNKIGEGMRYESSMIVGGYEGGTTFHILDDSRIRVISQVRYVVGFDTTIVNFEETE